MNKLKRLEILRIFEKNDPFPKTELEYKNSFELLTAILLSSRTRDSIVNKSTKKLFLIANNPEKIIRLGLNRLKKYIKNINFYNKKADYIIKISKILNKKYSGKVPGTRSSLLQLPGVGRKTVNVFLNIFLKKRTIGIDTHVYRVCNRTNFAVDNNYLLLEKKLIKLIPNRFKLNFHNWFVLHGRYICTARKMKCNFCLINKLCEFKNKNI
ncbi:Endonuclease III [Buchnera aphidicola (Tetraneura ulmi)]|uniref:endonuclease III n=1 Tax=Buchnera aphidicola TaxID=9 RepID=UPI003464285B